MRKSKAIKGHRRGHGVAARILAALAWLVAIASAVLWQLDRSLPGFARRRIEDALSSGQLAISIGDASFNVFRGLSLKDIRVLRKRTLDAPLVTIDGMDISLDISAYTPPASWISQVHCDGLRTAPFPDWDAFADSLPETSADKAQPPPDASEDQAQPFPNASFLFSARNALIMSVPARFIGFKFESSGGSIQLSGIRIVPSAVEGVESLSGQLSLDPGAGRLETLLSGTLTPSVIRDLTLSLEGDTAVEYYDAISHIQNPFAVAGEVSLQFGEGADAISDIRLTLSGNDFLFRGVHAQSLKFGLQWLTDSRNETEKGRRLVISPLDATFDEGKFSGRLAWYPRTHATDISAKSTLPLKPLFTVIDFPYPDCATNVVFPTPPRTEVAGRVFASREHGPDSFYGKIAAARATAFRLPLDDISASWDYDEASESACVRNFAATLAGGKIAASLDVSTATNTPQPFAFSLSASGVKADPLRRIFDPEAPQSDGHLSTRVDITGNLATNTLSSISGSVTARARKAAITRIPLFAGLTDFMGRNVAGIDLLVMLSDSDATISITNGLATIERLTVDGNMMSIVSRGKCRLDAPGMPVEGVAQVRFFHSRSLIGLLARIVTLPVSKLMEFRVYGPIERPEWDYIGLIDRLAEATFWPRKDATEEQ